METAGETLRRTLAAMARYVGVRDRRPDWRVVLGRVLLDANPKDDPKAFLQALVEGAAGVGDADTGTLTVLVEQGRWLQVAITAGGLREWTGRWLPVAGSVAALAIEAGRAVIVDDATLDARTVHSARAAHLGPILVAPVWLGARIVGVVALGRFAGRPAFGLADREMLAGFAEHMGWAVAHTGAEAPPSSDVERRDPTAAQLFDITLELSRIAASAGDGVALRLAGPIAALAAVMSRLDGEARPTHRPGSLLRAELLATFLAETAEQQLAAHVEIPTPLGDAPDDVRRAMSEWLGRGVRLAGQCGVNRWAQLTISAGPTSVELALRYEGRLPDEATLARFGVPSLAGDVTSRGDAERTVVVARSFDTSGGSAR
ncbi:GAF domain-containing protein [Kutzneria sp. CA-103260]|uniref:GAF domain-containing protein n=1 Tax=Kutzneria sp. CA-103260 TaxID=2802641 RepID=UPI001BA5D9A2|nr:GAF domain-containing protein [Kutzneria sp. CA-103260]QUQ64052.1 GAF domain protein [Kutzneria sp. CA-103260]